MNLYHVTFDLKDEAKTLAFAKSLGDWLAYLQGEGVIGPWRLLRRKLGLGADAHGDFLLEVEFRELAHLDEAFRHVGSHSDEVERLYHPVHSMIARTQVSIYRPFPDEERAERVALL